MEHVHSNSKISLDSLLQHQEVVVCCGSGGVGKTTLSATLGLRGAQLGRNVVVLTIDPAKRLADSLGIGELSNSAQKVPLPTEYTGKLDAMMLDVGEALNTLVHQNANSQEQIDQILNNSIYQQLSHTLGGGQEYGAMERLYQIHSEQTYDLIILDTPPSQNAIDFVMAPINMKEFFSQSVLRFLLLGGKNSSRQWSRNLLQKGGNLTLKLLEKLTGFQFIKDLSDFLLSFQGMYESFRVQAQHVSDLLSHSSTSFLIITGPEEQLIHESEELIRKITEFRLPLAGVLINKCYPKIEKLQKRLELPQSLQKEMEHLTLEHTHQLEYQEKLIQKLYRTLPNEVFVKQLPLFAIEMYQLNNLLQLSTYLSEEEI